LSDYELVDRPPEASFIHFFSKPYLQFDYAEALLMSACQGAGIIQAPKYIVAGAIARGELQPILTEFRSPESKPIAIVYPQKKYLSAKVRVFIEFMTALMGDLKRDGIVD
jgi:LysR family transcriptional regulator, regulator for bpeEF and oprC